MFMTLSSNASQVGAANGYDNVYLMTESPSAARAYRNQEQRQSRQRVVSRRNVTSSIQSRIEANNAEPTMFSFAG